MTQHHMKAAPPLSRAAQDSVQGQQPLRDAVLMPPARADDVHFCNCSCVASGAGSCLHGAACLPMTGWLVLL